MIHKGASDASATAVAPMATACARYPRPSARFRGISSPSTDPSGATNIAGISWISATAPAAVVPPWSNAYTSMATHVAHSAALKRK